MPVAPTAVTFTAVLRSFDGLGKWETALNLLFGMPPDAVAKSPSICTVALSVCEKDGAWEAALSLLYGMHLLSQSPNEFHFNSAISACTGAGQREMAWSLLERMREENVAQSSVTFSAGISACAKQGDWIMAMQLLRRMAEVGMPDCAFARECCALFFVSFVVRSLLVTVTPLKQVRLLFRCKPQPQMFFRHVITNVVLSPWKARIKLGHGRYGWRATLWHSVRQSAHVGRVALGSKPWSCCRIWRSSGS